MRGAHTGLSAAEASLLGFLRPMIRPATKMTPHTRPMASPMQMRLRRVRLWSESVDEKLSLSMLEELRTERRSDFLSLLLFSRDIADAMPFLIRSNCEIAPENKEKARKTGVLT